MNFDHFTIKQLQKEDVLDYFQFIDSNRDRIAQYFPTTIEKIEDIESTDSYIASKIELSNKKESFYFIIIDTLKKKISGSLILKNLDWNVQKCEISYFIDKKYEGKGITTKALSQLTGYCFKELKLNKAYLRIAKDNSPSIRVAEKNGFEREGILHQDFKLTNGNCIDVIFYGLLTPYKKII